MWSIVLPYVLLCGYFIRNNYYFQTFQEKKKPDNKEKTFIMVKPDGVQRGLIGEIIKRFEQRGFRLVAMKFMQVGPPERGKEGRECLA